MHWSPDVLMAMRSSRRYEPTEQSRQHRTTPTRNVRWTASSERSRPDYGCVDWFVYEEPQSERDHA